MRIDAGVEPLPRAWRPSFRLDLLDLRAAALADPSRPFTFRFNRRSSNHRGLLFYRLLEQSVQIEPKPLAKMLGGT